MDEQVLSLRDTLRVVLRHRRIVLVIALVGLLLGIAYGAAQSDLVSAKALVLLPPAPYSSTGVPTRDTQTEVDIVTSPLILTPAASAIGIKLPFSTLQHRVSASAPTDDLVQIVAKAPNAAQAEKLANEVASKFVSYLSGENSALETGEAQQLTSESQQLAAEIADYKAEITRDQGILTSDPTGPAAASEQSLINSLTQAEGDASSQARVVSNDLALAQLDGDASNSGGSVIQSATSAIKPSVLRIPEFGLIGLAVGLLVGVCAAFAVGRKDRRLRRRDEIARASGAAVLASLTPSKAFKSEDLLEVLENFRPSVSDKANLRRLLDELDVHKLGSRPETMHSQNGAAQNGAGQNGSSVHHEAVDVSAIVLAGDGKAVVAITELPAFAASLGLPVALVVDGSSASTQQLSIACAARDPLDLAAPRPNLLTFASTPAKSPEGVSLTVTVEVVDPVTLDVADESTVRSPSDRRQISILVVSSGFATPEDLEVVALASEHHGQPLAGVVVCDPERSDNTSGQQHARRVMGPNGPRQLAALRSTNR